MKMKTQTQTTHPFNRLNQFFNQFNQFNLNQSILSAMSLLMLAMLINCSNDSKKNTSTPPPPDSDNDKVADAIDAFPNDPNKNAFSVIDLSIIPSDTAATLTWSNPNAIITSINISYEVMGDSASVENFTPIVLPATIAINAVGLTQAITGLTTATTYTFTVTLVLGGTDANKNAEAITLERLIGRNLDEDEFADADPLELDEDGDGTNDDMDLFPRDPESTAVCGDLSPSVVPETASQRAANDATNEVYVAKDAWLIASGTGHRDDPFIIPLSDDCESINFVWEFTGLSIPATVSDATLMNTGFSDSDYHFARFTNLPATSTIYAQTTIIDRVKDKTIRDIGGFGTLRDTMINGDEPASLRYGVSSIPGTSEPDSKGQEHSLTQNFLDMRYITAPASSSTARNADGRIRFRILIEEPSE